MKVKEAFKTRLYDLCKAKNISLKDLCKNCGVIQAKIFSKQNTGIRADILQALCKGLGIRPKEFFKSNYFDHMQF